MSDLMMNSSWWPKSSKGANCFTPALDVWTFTQTASHLCFKLPSIAIFYRYTAANMKRLLIGTYRGANARHRWHRPKIMHSILKRSFFSLNSIITVLYVTSFRLPYNNTSTYNQPATDAIAEWRGKSVDIKATNIFDERIEELANVGQATRLRKWIEESS